MQHGQNCQILPLRGQVLRTYEFNVDGSHSGHFYRFQRRREDSLHCGQRCAEELEHVQKRLAALDIRRGVEGRAGHRDGEGSTDGHCLRSYCESVGVWRAEKNKKQFSGERRVLRAAPHRQGSAFWGRKPNQLAAKYRGDGHPEGKYYWRAPQQRQIKQR